MMRFGSAAMTRGQKIKMRLSPVVLIGLAAGWPVALFAQTVIKTDGSLGRPPLGVAGIHTSAPIPGNRGQSINVPGSVYTIPETLGKVSGSNLFHSFERFGVGSGDAATFTTTTATLQHVISRVTGGQRSEIYGLLSLQAVSGRTPDFYFINPAGVMFGAGAQIDVPGGFHVTTADRLKFEDGVIWSVTT